MWPPVTAWGWTSRGDQRGEVLEVGGGVPATVRWEQGRGGTEAVSHRWFRVELAATHAQRGRSQAVQREEQLAPPPLARGCQASIDPLPTYATMAATRGRRAAPPEYERAGCWPCPATTPGPTDRRQCPPRVSVGAAAWTPLSPTGWGTHPWRAPRAHPPAPTGPFRRAGYIPALASIPLPPSSSLLPPRPSSAAASRGADRGGCVRRKRFPSGGARCERAS